MTTTAPNQDTVFGSIGPWVEGLTWDDVPERAKLSVQHAVLDFLGVAVAGSRHDLAEKVLAYLDIARLLGDGSCGLIGRAERTSPESAALFNATVGHVLDFDDSSDTLGGHPTVVILPPLLALAGTRTVSGRGLLTAYTAGVEVAAHLANQVNIAHYERGWHPTATLGLFGGAAASAKLLGLDADGVAAALSIAAAFPSGLRAHFGTHMKSVQVGAAARDGLAAAFLAAAGVRGAPAAFEADQGFGVAYNGEDGFRRAPFDASADRTWDLVDPGLVVKQYPCCASAHPAVDAARDLLGEVPDGAEIAGIRIRLHPRRLRHTDNPAPTTPLAAKFSVQYLVATALATGSVTLGDFTPEALARPEVAALLARTRAEAFPPEEYGPDHYAGEVILEMTDGSTHRRRVAKARGRGTKLALSDEEITDKFRACVAPFLGSVTADAVVDGVAGLPSTADVRALLDLVTTAPDTTSKDTHP